MSGISYYTKEVLEQLRADLQKMKTVERTAASRAIAEAREKGDLRENAEYDAAKEAQGLLEAKIQRLEGELVNARIMEEGSIDTTKVSVLTKVTVTNLNTKKQVTYHLVSEKEADLKLGKISVTSPSERGCWANTLVKWPKCRYPPASSNSKWRTSPFNPSAYQGLDGHWCKVVPSGKYSA